MCPPGYHHSGSMATRELGHTMYGYTLLVPKNQSVLNKLSKERDTTFIIHICNHAMCPPGYHHSGSMATRELGHTMYRYTLLVPKKQRVFNELSKERNTTGQK